MKPEEWLDKIKDADSEFDGLHSRMRGDADLAKKKSYSLTDSEGNVVPNCDNVTLPLAAVFLNRANALVAGSDQQIIVETSPKDEKKNSTIESFLTDLYISIDEYLNGKGYPDLFLFHSHMINSRGRIGQRNTLRMEKEKFIPDALPLDCLDLVYETGEGGLAWGAPTFTRTKAQIEKEYEKDTGKATSEIRDLWTPDEEIIFLDNDFLQTNKNPRGYPPIVVQASTAGLMFLDSDRLKNSGESILWLNRDLYEEINKTASIIHTLSASSLFPVYQKEYEQIPVKKPENLPTAGKRATIPVKKGELFRLIPKQDLMAAVRLDWAILKSQLQEGSFSTAQMGTLQFPISGVLLRQLEAGRQLVLIHSIQALSMLYRASSRMLIKQYIELGGNIPIGAEGKKRTYSKADLEGDYSISFKYFQSSREQQIAGAAEAEAMGDLVSDSYKRRELIQVNEPDKVESELRAEQAAKADPVIALYQQMHSLIDEDKDIEARLVLRKIKMMLRQQSAPTETPEEKTKIPAGTIPLMGGGGQGGGRQPGDEGEEELQKIEQEAG